MNEFELKRYLLGQLPEPELSAVEEKIFTESASYEQALLVEDGLIDDYLSAQLGTSDQQDFLRYFLVTSERKQKLQMAKELRRLAAQNAPAPPDSWWQHFMAQFWQPIPLGVTALVVLGLALGSIYFSQLRTTKQTGIEITSITPSVIATPRQNPTPIKPTGNGKITLELSANQLRSITPPPPKQNTVTLNPSVAQLELQLPLETEATSVHVRVLNADGVELYQGTLPIAGKKEGVPYVSVKLATDNLFAGDYKMMIAPSSESEKTIKFQIKRE